MDRRTATLYFSLLANLIFAFVVYFTLFQTVSRQIIVDRETVGIYSTLDSDDKIDSTTLTQDDGYDNITDVKLRFMSGRPSTKPCKGNIFMLLMINSAPRNYERRSSIRETWGKADIIRSALGNYVWRTIFVIGDGHSKQINNQVNQEALKYGDMILADFGDDFRNLTYKTVLGMEWANAYCNEAKYFYKGDDDVMLNPFTLFPKLVFMGGKKLFMGNIMSGSVVIRQQNSRYYVSLKDLALSVYPDYCSGFAYVISMDVLQAMVAVVPKIRKIPIDDAYVGMLAKKVNIKVHWDRGFKPFGPIPGRKCEYNTVIAVHGILPSRQKLMMKEARNAFLTC
ncbi:Lactosylceramide 1,3-N-acetyl-beta-D-glucosaminyltransferase [Trichoplax sp. H2]|nr:Lactosylceramide 1,3-N-acetyl-beta-D-glucosaminyltransferase [Trichoplax sp. H2]|eukprot:RDD42836.1 Lactosylceramide 1,3-N-acetyl-beta-D-glucosaminyltransferase [Trichoplax sp. H2]